ncbi:MAG: leucine-rich repeat protein [Oscillospiraceae bacterium]
MQSSYKTGESVTFTWDSTSNTTHYNLWLARSIGNDKWENVEQVFYADNGMTRTFEAGEYRAQLLSYNSDLWETDHSDWVHTWSDDYFFTVEEPVLDSGTCGDKGSNVTWKLTEDGILTISGTGAMIDYGDDKSYRKTPWRDYFIESVRIDEGVTSIGGWAFKNCVLTSVMIPDSVTSIACGAFSGCRSLASVTIPEGVTSIDGYAFSGCSGLTSVTIPDSVTSIGEDAFSGCDSLTSVTIPDSVTSIGGGAFSGCSGLTSVTIPDSVTSIGDFAFRGCSGLTSVTIPSSVTSIGGGAFSGCTSLTAAAIPSSVTEIGGSAFSGCTGLTSVTIPDSVTSIDGYAFSGCSGLTDVYYAGTAADWAKISISEGNEDLLAAALHCKPTPLSAPAVTGGNDSQGRPTLKWNAVTGAAKYEVYRARSKDGDYIKYSTVTGTSYTNTSYIEDGNTYYYKVRALDANGTAGAWSSIVSVTYRAASTGTLSAPSVTGGKDSQGRPTLKWNAVTGAAKYEVYRARSKDGDYIKYSTVTGTSYTNISYIENGNTYYYKVRALKSDGTAGAWSSIVSVTYRAVSTGTLSAPAVTGGNDSQGRPTLKWNAVTGAAKYEVYRARSKDGDYIKYSTVTGTSYTNTSYIEDGNTYYYKVRALDANGTAGAWSSIVSVTYRAASTGTLSAPSVTGGKDSQGRPTLKWNAVTGAAKYEVYRARSKDGDYIKYSTVTGTSYTNISYIENGNTYYYKVRALKSDGTAGAWSSIVSVTYRAVSTGTLPAPTVTGGNDAQGRPTLTWKAVSGAAKYEVYRARSMNGDYIKYSTVTGTSYTNISYIENGNTYYYKVRALKSDGTAGAWSSIVSVTYRAASTGTLSAPTVTGGNDSQGRPTLTWKAVTGAAKYEVYRARSKDGDYIKYSSVTGTSYTNISYIENGNTYYYKVRALDANGTAGAWSSIVSVTYKQTLPAPTVTGGNDSQGRPTLKWNAVTGAAKYEVYRARSLNGDYIKYSTVTGTSYTNISYIENGNTYYYKVRALKSDGTAGAWSSIVSVTYRKPAAATVASGKCGDSAAWKLDAAGTLTISGTGRMYDYEWPADRGGTTPPWLANKYRDSIRALHVEQGITYIGRCAFDSCGNLSDVTLPTSLRIIGQCAFNDCTALRSIQLPEGLTTIMEDAFNAAGLVSITFPSTLGELRDGAFMNCEKLQSLRLPEGLTTIGNWAFYCNPNISSIYIPASVTTIGEEAFIYYNNLATVRYGGSQSQWSAVSVAANAFPDGVRYVYNVN